MDKDLHIAVAHLSLNFYGGAERLCLSVIKALKCKGHETTLVTVDKTDWKNARKIMGSVVLPDHEIFFTEIRFSKQLSMATIVLFFITFVIEFVQLRLKRTYDVVINTFGDLFTLMSDVSYVHFPLRANIAYSQTPPIINAFTWRVCSQFYNIFCKLFEKVDHSVILVNSTFIAKLVERFMHRKSIVVHPPVNTKTSSDAQNHERGDTVVTISRYSPKRHLETIPLIAKHTKSANFIIMGNADESSEGTIQRLNKLIDNFELREKVRMLTNVSRSRLLSVLSTSKVYLHVMPHEHFGISVVEAMANGCVPIVHRSGGPWLDIMEQKQGKYGYSYETPEEASKYIDLLVTKEDLRRETTLRAMKRSTEYDESIFNKKIVMTIEKIHRLKQM